MKADRLPEAAVDAGSACRTAQRGSTAVAIAEGLRAHILSGSYRPGDRLGEVVLAQRFNVSRGPVRQALRTLADSGLVHFAPNVGARVREIGPREMRHIYELREALEVAAAALAAERLDAAGAWRMYDLLRQHADVVSCEPSGAYLQQSGDADFHLFVARHSDNPRLLKLLSEDLYPQLMLLRCQHRHVRGRGRAALREHEWIAEAIAAGDAELAALAMRRHIRNSWKSLSGQIAEAPP